MQTPQRMTLAEFRDAMKLFLSTQCLEREKRLLCADCEAPIEHCQTCVSIHDVAFGDKCVASKPRHWTLLVPYCPRCESKPIAQGCLHLPLTEASNPS